MYLPTRQRQVASMVLTCTLHDPHAGLKWLSDQHFAELCGLFQTIIIIASPFTDKAYLEDLKYKGAQVVRREDNSIGITYFTAIQQAGEHSSDWVLYCDFDRVLHWMHYHKQELVALIQEQKLYDYAVLERTLEGYGEHHQALYETEQLPNKIISIAMGEMLQRDFFFGAALYSKKSMDIVVEQGGYKDLAHFGAWPVLLWRKGFSIVYKKCNGLSWETPNQYCEAVKKAGGVEAWRETLSTKEEWARRVGMAKEFVREIM